jgi:hypothetical protein
MFVLNLIYNNEQSKKVICVGGAVDAEDGKIYIICRRLSMSAARLIINRMIDELLDDMLSEIIHYIAFVQKNKNESVFREFEQASVSSMDFWDNAIDDEVWNDL